MPRSRLISVIPASPACGYSRDLAIVFSMCNDCSGATASVALTAFNRTCALGVIVEIEQLFPLVAVAYFQFLFDCHHFVEKAIEFHMIAPEQCPILIYPDGGEALEEVGYSHSLKFISCHGARLLARCCALARIACVKLNPDHIRTLRPNPTEWRIVSWDWTGPCSSGLGRLENAVFEIVQ